MIIIFFALLNSYFLPLSIAFKAFTDTITALVVLDDLNVYIFLLDMILGFNTTYTNVASGEEVFGHRFIATHYVFHDTFFIDLLSTFKLDRLGMSFGITNEGVLNWLSLLGFLKIQRLRRISKLISNMNATSEFKA